MTDIPPIASLRDISKTIQMSSSNERIDYFVKELLEALPPIMVEAARLGQSGICLGDYPTTASILRGAVVDAQWVAHGLHAALTPLGYKLVIDDDIYVLWEDL